MEQFLGLLQKSMVQLILIYGLTFAGLVASNRYSKKIVKAFRQKSDHPDFEKRTDTIGLVFRYLIDILLIIIAVVITLKKLGIDIGPILATAGVVGVAVGFGAQRLVQDLISGFFILLEDQIRVGDIVEINGKSGTVESVNLRMTILRDVSGNVHFIRNAKIDMVTNMTKDFSRMVFDIGVSYREDVDEVIEVIKQVDEDLRSDEAFKNDILEPIDVMGLERFDDSAVIIRARYTTMPVMQWAVGREFRRRLKKKFDEVDIEIPFPHRTVYQGVDKSGNAPPLNISGQDIKYSESEKGEY